MEAGETRGTKTKQRIFWLYPTIAHWMGGVRFVFEVSKRLARKHDVTLVVLRQSNEIAQVFDNAGIKVVCLEAPTYTEVAFWLTYPFVIGYCARKLKRTVGEKDIVISSMFPMNVIASKAHGHRIQILYEPFAMFHDKQYQKSHSRLIHTFSKMAALVFAQSDIAAVRSMDTVLSLSEYERANIQRVYGRDSGVIYEGVDFTHFHPQRDRILEKRFENSQVVFHSTGYDSFKGTDLVVESIPLILEEMPDTRFLISHTRINRAKIQSYIRFLKKNKAWNKVEFLGFVDYNLLPAYYALSAVYVEPGHGRSMSLSSKEANACGVLSVRGRVGTEDTIDGETGLLVDPFDRRGFAEKVVRLLKDKQERLKLSNRAREHVLEFFHWDAVVRRVERYFPNEDRREQK